MASEHHDDPEGFVVAHDEHDEEEVDELLPGEPRTPGWMPLLGGVLFIGASIWFVATQPPGKTAEELQKAAQAAAVEAAAKAAPPPAAAPMPPPQPGGGEAQPRKGG